MSQKETKMKNQPDRSSLRPEVIGPKSDAEVAKDGNFAPLTAGRFLEALVVELVRMRRDPTAFGLRRRVTCALGCPKVDGIGAAYALSHVDSEETGSWCPVHGWTSFDSVSCPPTERLRPHEIAERELAAKRKRGPRKGVSK